MALAAISLAAPLATALATTTSAAPDPPPAAGVTPGAALVGASRYIFFTAADGSVWRKRVGVAGQTPVHGVLVSGPSPIHLGTTATVLVFGRGTDGALWFNSCTVTACGTAWSSLGGVLTSKPGAVFRGPTAADYSVYVRGGDGAVWARDHSGSGWGPWHRIGGAVLAGTGPSAAFRSGTFVLVAGTNHGLFIANAGVTGFFAVGGVTGSSPALVNATVALTGFARGTTGAGFYHRFLASSPGWHSMGGFLTSGAGASASGNNTWTYGLGGNGQVYENHGTWAAYPPTFGGWIQRTP